MTAPVRVRFAPSPTGFLHVGGVRAALFNWLYARHYGGQFLLRIEDTDLERSEERYTSDIMASMKWLGLNWDEEPLYQSKRLDIYRQKADELVAAGHAYKCFCTEQEVEAMREKAMAEGKKPMYDRRCRELSPAQHPKDKTFVIRTKTPLTGHIEFTDLIRGPIRVENEEIDDFVLIRSNGAPTYNLSVVVDDVESRMTHIIRGDDHINNTPKQIHLYQFLKYPIPLFAHLPMILGPDKKKLSKRHGAVSANLYRADGFLPEAMLNFLARCGWSHGDQEIFTIKEMIEFFTFDHVQKSSAVFNTEKLLWTNGTHIRAADPKRLRDIVVSDFTDHFGTREQALARAKTDLATQLVTLVQPKVKTMKEMAEQLVPLCTPGAVEIDGSTLKWNKDENTKKAGQAAILHVAETLAGKLKGVTTKRADTAAWGNSPALSDIGMGHAEVDAFLRQMAESRGVKLGDLAQPMRLGVTGSLNGGAGLFDLMAILPWEVVEARLKKVATL